MNKFLSGAMLVATVIGLSGCTVYQYSTVKSDKFDEFLKEYKELNGEKAIAMAKDKTGSHVYGYAYNRQTQAEANKVAIAECEDRNKDAGIDAACKIYKEGN